MCESAWRISSPTRRGRCPEGAADFFFLGISALQSPGSRPESSVPLAIPDEGIRLGPIDPGLFRGAIGMGVAGMPVPRAALHLGIGGGNRRMGPQVIPEREMACAWGEPMAKKWSCATR